MLPIIIDQKSKTASFYQFKDNHIYNFAYESTFIGELVDMACILELASQDGPAPSSQVRNSAVLEQDDEDTDVS